MKNRIWKFALGIIAPLLLLAFWWVKSHDGSFTASELPTPTSFFSVINELLHRGELWWNISISLQRVILGYLIGGTIAITLGSLAGLVPAVNTLLTPLLSAIRAVPSLAWVPLLIIWLGIGESPKLTLIAIGAFFPIFTTTVSGIKHVDKSLIELGRAYGMKKHELLRKIYLPAAAPQLFSGLRLAMAQSWLFLVAAELIASSRGLGFLLVDAQQSARTDIVIFAIVSLAILGKISDVLLSIAERKVLAWSHI